MRVPRPGILNIPARIPNNHTKDMTSKIDVFIETIPKVLRSLQPHALVVHDLKLLYFPIPKAASTSILRYFLEHAFMKNQTIPGGLTPNNIHGYYAYPFISLRESMKLQKQGYRSFGVKRDPEKRIASCYRDKILDSKLNGQPLRSGFDRYNRLLGKRIFHTDMSYRQFVLTISKIPDFLSDEHFRSQYRFLPQRGGAILLDRLLSLENFGNEADVMCEEFGIPKFKRGKANVTLATDDAGQSPRFESEEVSEIVRNRYGKDYLLLGY